MGIYFTEEGASQRSSVCIYGSDHSAIQETTSADFDWDAIFEDVDWFHFTGITLALGPNVVDICREACKTTKAHGMKISCNLNRRGKLWIRDQARAAMTDLCQYVDMCISNDEDAKDVFSIEVEATDIYAGEINREGYKSVAKQLADKFGFEKVAITFRKSPPSLITAGASCCTTWPAASTASPRSATCTSSTAWAAAIDPGGFRDNRDTDDIFGLEHLSINGSAHMTQVFVSPKSALPKHQEW